MDIEKQLAEIRERNAERLKIAKEKLGTKWVLHPANATKRK